MAPPALQAKQMNHKHEKGGPACASTALRMVSGRLAPLHENLYFLPIQDRK